MPSLTTSQQKTNSSVLNLVLMKSQASYLQHRVTNWLEMLVVERVVTVEWGDMAS
jgi:hypothetical protein